MRKILEGTLLHGCDSQAMEYNIKSRLTPRLPYNGDFSCICFSMMPVKGFHDMICNHLPSLDGEDEKYAFGLLPESVPHDTGVVKAVGMHFERNRDFLYPNLSPNYKIKTQEYTENYEVRIYRPIEIELCDFILVPTEAYRSKVINLLRDAEKAVPVWLVSEIKEE